MRYLGQSQNKGCKTVEAAWATRQAVDLLQDEVHDLAVQAADLNLKPYERSDAQERLPGIKKKLESL